MRYEIEEAKETAEIIDGIGDKAMGEDREKWIYGLPRDCFVRHLHKAASLLNSYAEEVKFLKAVSADAARKQEPMNPKTKVRKGANPRTDFFCPVCLRQLYRKTYKYCANCGQAIKWD